jgi:peroxiredoxin
MRNFFVILVLVLSIVSCKKAKNEYTIKGTIDGIKTGKVYLEKLVDGQPQTVDTTDVTDGKFSFKGEIPIPDIRLLRLDEQSYFAQFFLENSKITVTAKKDSLRNTKISGSASQDIFQIYLNEMMRLQKDVKSLHQKYQTAMAAGNSSEAEKAKIDYQALMDNSLVFFKNFVKDHPNSVVSAFVTGLQLAPQVNETELEAIVNNFSPEISSSQYVLQLKKLVEEKKVTAVGVMAPDFEMNDPNGKPVKLSALRGQIVLLDFWASWCAPCRQENPNVVKLYQKYHSKGFEILGVSLDRTKAKWIEAIQADQLTWLHVSDLQFWQNAAALKYAVTSIPQSFLIGKDGKIIGKGLRGEELDKKLAEIFPN